MPTCFVVQGFHKKTDFESGRVLDLDASYDVIKEAVESAGYTCVRADEIPHSRSIDLVMYEQLLSADLVIADLSTSNVNAFYELGVRFALRPYSTIVVAEDQLNFPFDINHIPIHTYRHLGDDIGRREARRFIDELVELIGAVTGGASPKTDSPVFTFLSALSPPMIPDRARLETVTASDGEGDSLLDLKQEALAAMKASDFAAAMRLWAELRAKGPKDDYVVQQLALATYKSEQPSPIEALHTARGVLEYLWPEKSLDPETLGLWAAVNKRLYEAEGDPEALDEAITATEKGWVLRSDYYNGINLAFLLDTRAARSAPELAAEDHARAQGVRRRVAEICEQRVDATGAEASDHDAEESSSGAGGAESDDRYWVLATLEEAAVGLGDHDAAEGWRTAAAEIATADWQLSSTAEQIKKLQALIATIDAKLEAPR